MRPFARISSPLSFLALHILTGYTTSNTQRLAYLLFKDCRIDYVFWSCGLNWPLVTCISAQHVVSPEDFAYSVLSSNANQTLLFQKAPWN